MSGNGLTRAKPGASVAFGRIYEELTQAEPTDGQLAAQRARLLLRARRDGLTDARSMAIRRVWFVVPSLALAVAVFLIAGRTLWSSSTDELTAQWGGESVTPGTQLGASGGKAASLSFSDGSRIQFEPDSVGEMSALEEARTEVRVLRGTVDAEINRATGATWDLVAGPYRVSVVGTKFTVVWDPESKHFEVSVRQGNVRVSGGDLGATGVAISAGQNITRGPPEDPTGRSEVDRSSAPVAEEAQLPALEAQDQAGHARGDADAPARLPRVAAKKTPATGSKQGLSVAEPPSNVEKEEAVRETAPDWQQLARTGKYREAYGQISTLGFDTALGGASAEQMLLLANTARYAGHPAEASRAYSELRRHHPQSSGARIAAFYLARIAQDTKAQPREAVRWLETYLREAPGGSLAATARARLIDIYLQLGERGAARKVARDYIRLHSDGPHVGLARSLVHSTSRP